MALPMMFPPGVLTVPYRRPPRITAVVEMTRAPEAFTADCDPKPKPRRESFEDVYRWNAVEKRYLRERGNIDRLDRWNQQHL